MSYQSVTCTKLSVILPKRLLLAIESIVMYMLMAKPRCLFRTLAMIFFGAACFCCPGVCPGQETDHLRSLHQKAISDGVAAWGHWGARPDDFTEWQTHTNRLVPVYTFGANLDQLDGPNSAYRNPNKLTRIYGRVPMGTLYPEAEYFDQTDIYKLQVAAMVSGEKYIIMVIFDGMDWQTTQTTSIYRSGRVAYTEGRGTGLAFQNYDRVETDFGFMVTSPHNDRTEINVDKQIATLSDVTPQEAYHPFQGGTTPWARPGELAYLEGKGERWVHPYTDSASSGTAMMSGAKTYSKAINMDRSGSGVTPMSRHLQESREYGVGVVTSVPFCHATPATAYAQNVTHDDYQDLARDLFGLSSASHADDVKAATHLMYPKS